MRICGSSLQTQAAEGSLIIRCARCGRVLHAEPYRSAGIGPICAEKIGVRVLGADPAEVAYGQYARKAPKPSRHKRFRLPPVTHLSHHPVDDDDAEQLDLFSIGEAVETTEASEEAKE